MDVVDGLRSTRCILSSWMLEPRWRYHRDVSDAGMQEVGCFAPPLDVMTAWSPHRLPTRPKTMSTKMSYDVLFFLLDGDVWVDHLDVDIRCLDCAHILDECVTDGSDALICDDAEVANDA